MRFVAREERIHEALDLAKLSLWLATLARDHQFTFLDHALKSGDSLVGLDRRQIGALSFEPDPLQETLWSQQVRARMERVAAHRAEIRNAPDDVALARQEAQHGAIERELARVRLIGDAVVATYFAHGKDRARVEAARELERQLKEQKPERPQTEGAEYVSSV